MGSNGEDCVMSPLAKRSTNLAVECKARAKGFNVQQTPTALLISR